ncbi:MAG: hypothetical protein ABH887_02075 [bacterium]
MKYKKIISTIILDSVLAFVASVLIFPYWTKVSLIIGMPESFILSCFISGVIISFTIDIDRVIVYIKKALFNSLIFGLTFGCIIGIRFRNDIAVEMSIVESFLRGFLFLGLLPALILFLAGFLIRLVAYLIAKPINRFFERG